MVHYAFAALLLLLPASECFRCGFYVRSRPTRHSCTGSAAIALASNNEDRGRVFSTREFYVEQVTSRERFYDLSVFRYRNAPLEQYLEENPKQARQESIKILTNKKCNDRGQDLAFVGGPAGVLVQFVAIWMEDDEAIYQKSHGVIGAVDAHCYYISNEDNVGFPTKDSGAIVELKNLRVDDSLRRKGVASALVNALQEYTKSMCTPTTVYLNTDLDNFGARALYHRKGFVEDATEADKMVWFAE